MDNFSSFLENKSFHQVVKHSGDYTWIDISKNNQDLLMVDVAKTNDFAQFVNKTLAKNNASIGVGGYREPRNIYKRSVDFNDTSVDERYIHIGLDVWTTENTPVYAPCDATIHSFTNNLGLGNYGPTIILEHNIDDVSFYTLYGHLTECSINSISVGDKVIEGEAFCKIGMYPTNGDYPPHLHFQVMKDIGDYISDYPGVASENELEKLCKNCPDPNLILKFETI